jgi:hypothetical protein
VQRTGRSLVITKVDRKMILFAIITKVDGKMILFKWHGVQEQLKYLHRHTHISHACYEMCDFKNFKRKRNLCKKNTPIIQNNVTLLVN